MDLIRCSDKDCVLLSVIPKVSWLTYVIPIEIDKWQVFLQNYMGDLHYRFFYWLILPSVYLNVYMIDTDCTWMSEDDKFPYMMILLPYMDDTSEFAFHVRKKLFQRVSSCGL